MVTAIGRKRWLRRSIACFRQQAYESKELIIVVSGPQWHRNRVVKISEAASQGDISVVQMVGDEPLGALRNHALAAARGALVCQWDDDDLNHPERLSVQVDEILRAEAGACYLAEQLHLFWDEGRLFVCDWSSSRRHIGIPGTLLARREIVPRYPPQFKCGEDSIVHDQLLTRTRIRVLRGAPHLFIYIYHGRNTFPRSHHMALVERYGMNHLQIERVRNQIIETLRLVNLRRPLLLCEPGGNVVMRLDPKRRMSMKHG